MISDVRTVSETALFKREAAEVRSQAERSEFIDKRRHMIPQGEKQTDEEMARFQSDLLAAVRQMKAGQAARTTQVPLTPAADAPPKRAA
jgi:hypothetical protein